MSASKTPRRAVGVAPVASAVPPGSVSPPVAEPGPHSSSSSLRSEPQEVAARTKKPGRGIGASPVSLSGLHAAAMTEAELEEQVRDACRKLGVIRIHIYHARGTTPGVPDDILIGPRGVLWRELKTMTGKVSPAQRAMGEALLAAGQDFDTWRPVDWFSGRIKSELTAISGLRVATA